MKNRVIKSLKFVAREIEKSKEKSRKIILCHGVFDLLHLGHIKYFQEAKTFGDLLIVTVTPDEFVRKGPGRPVFNSEQRAEAIAALEVVDYVAINKWPIAVKTIELLQPDYYVKGPDYKNQTNDVTGNIKLEEEAVEKSGGEIKFTSDITFSSTQLINQNIAIYSSEQKSFIDKLKKKYSVADVIKYFDKMKSKKLLLVGEIILDEYVSCNTLGKAGKDPMLTLQKLKSEIFPGGVLAVANHLAEFCKSINVMGYLGQDGGYEDYINESLKKNIVFEYLKKVNSPTILKRRYLDSEKKSKIIGVYDINDDIINEKEEKLLSKMLLAEIADSDAVIVADYGHGLMTTKIIDLLIKNSKYLCVNTQLNSANIGFHTISKYHKVNYVCMHEGELRHDFRSKTRDVKELTTDLYDRVNADLVTVTQGARGALCYDKNEGFETCPAFASKVLDKVGAGDTLFAFTSLCFLVGMPHDLTLLLGNIAAAETVSSIGNSKSLENMALLKTVETLFK